MVHALLVEDDRTSLDALNELVQSEGFTTATARSIEEARRRLEDCMPDLALVDLQLPDGNGLDLIEELQSGFESEIVVITGHATVDSAVEALRSGALEYLTKPVDPAELRKLLANCLRTLGLRNEVVTLRAELRKLGRFGRMIGNSSPIQRVYDMIARVAPTETTVFLTGETGTGKELAAETVHRLSRRSSGPFVPINCGAVQETLIESELFGHEKGSFTGADRVRRGLFEQAEGGTLFLDEVTEMPVDLQVKLLRVLESRTITRVGGQKPIDVDVRVIAATNRDPKQAVQQSVLREDLFYRLMVFPIALPPLRERAEDIELLASFFLENLNQKVESPRKLEPEALECLAGYHWPGNVRELRNVIERAFILSTDRIGAAEILLPDEPRRSSSDGLQVQVGTSIAETEKQLILATLEQLDGNKKRAAEMLGISLKTLYNRLNQYGPRV